MKQQKVGIAMSGGVDSSVSASLLQQQGYEVHGFFMLLPLPGVEKHMHRVQTVADYLRIHLHCISMEEIFSRTVIDYFIRTYRSGLTPNPCVRCNQKIKFGALLQCMRDKGMNKIATGHYARTGKTGNGKTVLQRGIDPRKDQSYFLCRLSSDQLEQIIFPLGEMTKDAVYIKAAQLNLENLHGPESQDVCFLSGKSISSFMESKGIYESPGDIVTEKGKIIGRHRGLWHYTIGQRRGLNLPDSSPWYVQQLDGENNILTVCKNDALFTRRITVRHVLWNDSAEQKEWQGKVQIRGRHKASPATVSRVENDLWQITFEKRQRAVTPGQFAVFYQDNSVLGSGIITDGAAEEKKVA